jgi:hypothetical protein
MNPRAGYGTPRYGDCHIISKWGNGIGGAASYNFGVTSEGHLYVATFNNSVTTQVRDTSVVSTNTWHSVVLVRDATSYRLYRDGTLLFSTNSLVQPQHNSGLNLNLGREGSSNDGFYGGALDDVRIYNRALSDSEIFELYTWELGTRVEILKAVRPSFSNLSIGTKYQLQTSSNLTAWTNEGSPFTATASSMVYPGYWDVVNWNTLNFRLHVVP